MSEKHWRVKKGKLQHRCKEDGWWVINVPYQCKWCSKHVPRTLMCFLEMKKNLLPEQKKSNLADLLYTKSRK